MDNEDIKDCGYDHAITIYPSFKRFRILDYGLPEIVYGFGGRSLGGVICIDIP